MGEHSFLNRCGGSDVALAIEMIDILRKLVAAGEPEQQHAGGSVILSWRHVGRGRRADILTPLGQIDEVRASFNRDRTAIEVVSPLTRSPIATFREDFLVGRDRVHGCHRMTFIQILDQWKTQIAEPTDEVAMARHRRQCERAGTLASVALGALHGGWSESQLTLGCRYWSPTIAEPFCRHGGVYTTLASAWVPQCRGVISNRLADLLAEAVDLDWEVEAKLINAKNRRLVCSMSRPVTVPLTPLNPIDTLRLLADLGIDEPLIRARPACVARAA